MSAQREAATERDIIKTDAVIVGAGPAGLSCAIRLKQLRPELSVCVLEKAASVGAHALSGAVIEPGSLDALLPGWRDAPPEICVPAVRDEFALLTRHGSLRLPTPPQMHNRGNLIISLGQLTALLAQRAEALGVDIFAGFSAASTLHDDSDDGRVTGVQIGDMGLQRDGTRGPGFAPGPQIHARVSFIAEGARGSITKQLIRRFHLDADANPQSFGLGMKELWQLPPGRVTPGLIKHTVGWPLDTRTYGGSFSYHLDRDRVYVGFVVGLDYIDPRLQPFEAFQQFKAHPSMQSLLEGGEIISAGARAIAAGGWQSMPRMEMPGALLIGDTAGVLNVPKIKGVHQAIRCGALAAEHWCAGETTAGFTARWRISPGGRELQAVRNIKPGFKRGLWMGLANAALETVTGGHLPWTLRSAADFEHLAQLDHYVSPNRGWVARTLPPRDRLASVFFASTSHDESQPIHLKVRDTRICIERCTREFGNPCERFCPANVYEMVDDGAGLRHLQINAANCVHCKACDIKDPYAIIDWTVPEGGSGPNYQAL